MPTIDTLMQRTYTTRVERDVAGGSPCFVARHPELPGCLGWGRTWREAIRDLAIARRAYFEACLAEGMAVPIPSSELRPMPVRVQSRVWGTAVLTPGPPPPATAPAAVNAEPVWEPLALSSAPELASETDE